MKHLENILVIFILIFFNFTFAQSKENIKVEQIKNLISSNDFIGARILIKKQFKEEFDFGIWRDIRNLIYREQRIGYDLIFAFDNHPNKNAFLDKNETEINNLTNHADHYML
jgi:hypothetical protein